MAKIEEHDDAIDHADHEKEDTLSKTLPDNDEEASNASDGEANGDNDHDDEPAHNVQPSQNNGRAAKFKRFLLWSVVPFCIWLFFTLKKENTKPPQVIYASRYSKEHKFRPAASPIITETLRDGRIRIRGGNPTPTPVPTPTSSPKKKKRTKRGAKSSGHKAKRAHKPW